MLQATAALMPIRIDRHAYKRNVLHRHCQTPSALAIHRQRWARSRTCPTLRLLAGRLRQAILMKAEPSQSTTPVA